MFVHGIIMSLDASTVLFLALLYVVPTIAAVVFAGRGVLLRIVLVNLLLGWTVLGWLLAFAWAMGGSNVLDRSDQSDGSIDP